MDFDKNFHIEPLRCRNTGHWGILYYVDLDTTYQRKCSLEGFL